MVLNITDPQGHLKVSAILSHRCANRTKQHADVDGCCKAFPATIHIHRQLQKSIAVVSAAGGPGLMASGVAVFI